MFQPVTEVFAVRCKDPAVSAGRLLAGTDESPELPRSLTLRLPASWQEERKGTLAPPADMLMRISAGTSGIFFLQNGAILNSLRSAREP
jgi:hypothetical protein